MPDCMTRRFRWLLLLLAYLACGPARAADPARGARLFASTPVQGQLACIDCHSDNPQVNNFGNIFSGRNAGSLIERAISLNTGGMSYFSRYYSPVDLADIAAYLGNWPASADFGRTAVGSSSALRTITIATSTKQGLDMLSLGIEGDFALAGGDCGTAIARFSSCTVDVVFKPTAAVARSGALVISHSTTPTPIRIALDGQGEVVPRAVARVLPQALDFGSLAVGGAPRTRTITVANDSPDPLTLKQLDVQPADYVWAGGSCRAGVQLPAGQRCSVSLRFAPRQGGGRPGQLTIGHDGIGGESGVALQGQGEPAGALVEAEPAWLDFGVLELGGLPATPQTLTLRNRGAQPWQAPAVRLGDAQFSVLQDGCAGTTVAPGRHCQLVIAVEPRRAGPAQAELLADAGVRVPLMARAIPSGGAWLAAEPARPRVEAAAGQSALFKVALSNHGAAALQLQQIALSGADATDFAVLPDSECRAGLQLPAGGVCSLALRFAPLSASGTGSRFARLRIDTASAGVPVLLLDLRGGVRPQPASQLWIDTQALRFAARLSGTAGELQTQAIALSNRGDASLRWRSLAVVGAWAADFKLSAGDCAAGLSAGASCHVRLSFDPQPGPAQERLASLVLQAEDEPQAAVVPLRGWAAAAETVPRPESARLDFGRQPVGVEPGAVRSLRLLQEGVLLAAPLLRAEGPFQVAALDPACARGLAGFGEACQVTLRFVPVSVGPATGRLWIQAGGMEQAVVLAGEGVETAPLLAWQTVPAQASHADTAVGSSSGSETLVLLNRGNASSAPLLWQFGGAAAAEFSVDPMSTSCHPGQRLAAGESCRLRVLFHPRAGGLREAALHVGAAAAPPLLSWPLLARGHAGVAAVAQLLPVGLDFVAEGGSPPPARVLWLRNDGNAALGLASVGLQGSGFALGGEVGPSCAEAALVLLPGEACALSLAWLGRSDGAAGNALLLGGDATLGELSVPLTVSESPTLRSNEGGGGGMFSGMLLLWLAIAAMALRQPVRARPR